MDSRIRKLIRRRLAFAHRRAILRTVLSAGFLLALLCGLSLAQCNDKAVVQPAAARPIVNVVISERLFAAANRNDVVGAMKVWSDLLACLNHQSIDTKVEVISAPREVRQRVVDKRVHVLVLDNLEFMELSDEGLVEGIGVASREGQPLAPRYLLLVSPQTNSLTELRGKRAVFYLRTGSAVSVAWMATLLTKNRLGGIENFFSSAETATKPTNCILPLFFGRIEACIIDSTSWETAQELNPQMGSKLKIFAQSVQVLEGVTAVPKLAAEDRQRIIRAVLDMHKLPVGEQILRVFRTGPMIPYRAEYFESTRQFWKDYERTLTPEQWKQWNESLLPVLPALARPASGLPGSLTAGR